MIKNYFHSFWKHYISRKPKLILTIALSVLVYFWIANNINLIPSDFFEYTVLARSNSGIYFVFIKPIFVYIAGILVINKI